MATRSAEIKKGGGEEKRRMSGANDGLLYGMGNIGTACNIKDWQLSGSISGWVSQECGSVRAADDKSQHSTGSG